MIEAVCRDSGKKPGARTPGFVFRFSQNGRHGSSKCRDSQEDVEQSHSEFGVRETKTGAPPWPKRERGLGYSSLPKPAVFCAEGTPSPRRSAGRQGSTAITERARGKTGSGLH